VRNPRFWPWAGALAMLLVGLTADYAWAAIPAVVGPVQALIAILPQLMAMLGAALVAMLKPGTYKVLAKYLWTHKVFTVGLAGFIWLCVWGCGRVFAGGVGAEQVGASWTAFRGGPERAGAVKNAAGPKVAAKVAWKYQENNLERLDSSPCVVGNRVYASTGTLRLIGASTGSIYCRDADKGGEVWTWNGRDIADKAMRDGWDKAGKTLKPIFSSPVVGGDFKGCNDVPKEKDGFQQGRYLVVGEGYHTDWNSRIICLDLEPVKTNKAKVPELKWFKQTTCHVESSPCILGDKVYIGAADDGIWCIELESGKTVWRLEGSPAYYVTAGDKASKLENEKAAELEKLVGKYVKAIGIVERLGATVTDPGEAKFAVETFEPLAGSRPLTPEELNLDNGQTFRRVVLGKVTLVEKPPMINLENKILPLPGISKVSIVPDEVVVDVESSPVAVRMSEKQAGKGAAPVAPKELADLPEDQRKLDRIQVFVGSGVGGEAVACVDGVTGKLLWTTEKTQGKFGFPVFGSPTVVGDRVVVGMGNGDIINDDPKPKGEVRCLSAATGELHWKLLAGNTFLGAVPVYTDQDGNSLAYACSRDKNLYVLDVKDGRVVKKVWIGSPMVCSPAVTNDAVYLTTNGGKVVCVDRRNNSKKWDFPMCPGQEIISSPAVAGGRLFVGSVSKGLFCLVNNPAGAVKKAAQPWSGPGGTAAHNGTADELGLPGISGQTIPRKWASWALCQFNAEGDVERSLPLAGPVAACGQALYLTTRNEKAADDKPHLARVSLVTGKQEWIQDRDVPVSALAANEANVFALVGAKGEAQKPVCLDARTGQAVWGLAPDLSEGALTLCGGRLLVAPKAGGLRCLPVSGGDKLWERPVGTVVGSPAAGWDLVFVNVGGEAPTLLCLDIAKGQTLWSVKLPGKPVGAPAAVPAAGGGRVFAACEGAEAGQGRMFCARLVDGAPLWTKDLPAAPIHWPAASEDLVAVACANGAMFAFAAADGKSLREEGYMVDPSLQPPAVVEGTVVCAAKNRIATWTPSSSDFKRFGSQGVIGAALSQPVIAGETIYVATEKKGLVGVAPPPPPEVFDTEPAEDGKPVKAGRPPIKFSLREEVNGLDLATMQLDLFRKNETVVKPGQKPPEDEKLGALIAAGAYTFDCPELGIKKGTAAGVAKGEVVTVTATSLEPLGPGIYEIKLKVSSKAAAKADASWKFTIK
jgi:outer membrane protein assembly factor BamB